MRGSTLLDACAALALSSLAAATVLAGVRPLACALRLEAARTALIDALFEARRASYEREAIVAVETHAGSSQAVIQPGGAVRAFADGVVIASAPADGDVTFRPSGLADNATLTLACGAAKASVVVNQRGVVR